MHTQFAAECLQVSGLNSLLFHNDVETIKQIRINELGRPEIKQDFNLLQKNNTNCKMKIDLTGMRQRREYGRSELHAIVSFSLCARNEEPVQTSTNQ